MAEEIYNPYISPSKEDENYIFNSSLNTNINDYSMEDIFNLLDITI